MPENGEKNMLIIVSPTHKIMPSKALFSSHAKVIRFTFKHETSTTENFQVKYNAITEFLGIFLKLIRC